MLAGALACPAAKPARRQGASDGATQLGTTDRTAGERAWGGGGPASAFVSDEVTAWRGARVELLFMRPDEVMQVLVPVRPPAAGSVGTRRTARYTIGADSAEAQRYTGPGAHVIMRPAGAVDTRRELLRREAALEGHVTVTPVWRLVADEQGVMLDSLTVTVERLRFPSGGPVRVATVSRPVYSYPP